jgi:acetoin:2,6-dichlorophenolindophenol oxidoreductase subunit alpha
MPPIIDYRTLYTLMLRTRHLEEAIVEEYKRGCTFGPIHLCLGQEAAGVGATAVLAPGDVVTTTHRGHAHYVGKGLDLRRLCCEIWGKADGYGRGRAGHMILIDREVGLLAGSGIVGGGIPVAVGQALAFQIKREPRVVVSCFGDGASNTGAFHEALNMAGLWRLPVVFFCENNRFGLTVPVRDHLSVEDIAVRAQGYNMPGVVVDGNRIEAVAPAVVEAVERARAGGGPTLIEAKTYRMHGFSTSDQGGYQSAEDIASWRERDPVTLGAEYLVRSGIAVQAEIESMDAAARRAVADAVASALAAPDPTDADLSTAVWKE